MANTIDVPEIQKGGPYSHAVVSGSTIFLSGQVGTISGRSTDFEQQFENAMIKVTKILNAGEFSLKNVVKTSIYLARMEDFGKLNELYSKYFQTNPPARTTVVTGFVSKDVLVEVDVIGSK